MRMRSTVYPYLVTWCARAVSSAAVARAFLQPHRGGRKDRACAGCTPERHRTAVVVTAMHDDAARALGVARAHARPSAHNLPMHTSVCACVAKRHGKKGGSKLFLRLFWLRVSELELFWRG